MELAGTIKGFPSAKKKTQGFYVKAPPSPMKAGCDMGLQKLFPQHNRVWLDEVWAYIERLTRRWPKASLAFSQLPWLLASCGPTDTQHRKAQWVVGLACRLGRLAKEVDRSYKIDPSNPHICSSSFSVVVDYLFEQQQVLGVAIATKLPSSNQFLPNEAPLHAVQAISPTLQLTNEMSLAYFDPITSIQFFYFEVKKHGHNSVTLRERLSLVRELPFAIQQRIQKRATPVFMPRNEEETLKGIVTLSQQLDSFKDLPQLILNFQQAEDENLTFNGILVRTLGPDSPSLDFLKQQLQVGVAWKIEQVQMLTRSQETPKQAISFLLTFPQAPYIRPDGAVDFRKGRQFAFTILQQLFSQVRDYNGGWMTEQAKILDRAKELLGSVAQHQLLLLETLFYSITPKVIQSYFPPRLLVKALSLIQCGAQKFLSQTTSSALREPYRILSSSMAEGQMMVIMYENNALNLSLEEVIAPYYPHLASALFSYLGFGVAVIINTHVETEQMEACIEVIRKALIEWAVTQRSQQVLRLCIQKVKPSLDPRLRADRRSSPLVSFLYEGLMKLDRTGHPIHAVAKKVEISPDGLVYRFQLRLSHWSNGKPVTAHDFEHAWKAFLDPKFKKHVAFAFYPIKGAFKAERGQVNVDEVGIFAEDAQTLVVELERPTPHFLAYLANPVFSPLYKDIDRLCPGWAFSHSNEFIGNGPFIPLKVDGDALLLTRNLHYWDASSISLDKIDILQSDTPDNILALWERGRLDWIGDPLCPISFRDLALVEEKIPLKTASTGAVCCLYFNTQQEPFTDREKRQGIASVLRGNQRLIGAFPKGATPTERYAPSSIGLNTDFPTSLEASSILPPVLELIYPYPDELEGICIGIAREIEEFFGVRVVVKGVSWAAFYEEGLVASRAHLGVAVWYPWCADPMSYFDRFSCLSPANFSMWHNNRYCELLKQADLASTKEERLHYLSLAEELLLREAPLTPLYFHAYRYATNKWAKKLETNELGLININDVYIKQDRTYAI